MRRRDFFSNLFAFFPLVLGFLGISKMGLDFVTSRKKTKLRKVFATNLDHLPLNLSKNMKDLKGKEFMLVRTGKNQVKALSTTCTHLGCSVYWKPDKSIFFCPCHNGVFDADGNVLKGPPPRKLDSYETVVENSNVYVYLEEKDA